MKTTCLFVVLLALTAQFAQSSLIDSKITSLLEMQTSASDAIDTVLNLLKDLKNANIKEQQEADALNKTQEKEGRAQIAQLTKVRDANQKILDNAIAHTKYVETELADTKAYISWIVNRRKDIKNNLEKLADQRCYANGLFVKALKEHIEAIDVIELLIKDLAPFTNKQVSLSQIENISEKLRMYSHLFNEQAMSDFLELGRTKYEDNDKKALKIKGFKSGTDTRDLKAKLGDNVVTLLRKLQAHLKLSQKNLAQFEIKAAYDFAAYQQKSEDELKSLASEQDRKQKYQAKLEIDLEVAQTFQAKAQKELDDSKKALQAAIDDLNAKRLYYKNETARRNAENKVLDEVIQIFENKVSSVAQYLRGRVEDFNTDKKFDKTDLQSRKIDAQVKKDSGKLKKNVVKESKA